MIGKVTTSEGLVVVLNDDHTISCDNPRLKKWAETGLLLYDFHSGPASGPWGVFYLNNLAQLLKGKAEITPQPEDPPGTIY